MIDFLIAILRSGTPLVYVTLAGVIAQRAGVWNLGLEGIMIVGACATIFGIVLTGSFVTALALACLCCIAMSVLLWFVIEKIRANPIIAGLGITGLGIGATNLATQAVFGSQAAVTAPFGIPRLGEAFGPFGTLSILVALMPFTVLAMWLLLRRTRFGLQLGACGEHPFAARGAGVSPPIMRLFALALGGALCALAGAELAAGSLHIFSQGMTAGRGFMGFAAVIFGSGHPVWSSCAALFYSIVEAVGIKVQLAYGEAVPRDLLLMVPYAATVFGLWLSGRLRGQGAAGNAGTELRDY